MPTEVCTVVVDASVAFKWFVPEPDSEHAERLLSPGVRLLAPDLLYAEFGNILWKQIRRGALTSAEADVAIKGLQGVSLQIAPSEALLTPAFEIACANNRTVYDSLYVALAMIEETVLVTADERLFNAIARGPLSPHIALLADFANSAWPRQSPDARV